MEAWLGKLQYYYTHFLVLLSRGEPLLLDSCHVEYICVGKSQFQVGVSLLETMKIYNNCKPQNIM